MGQALVNLVCLFIHVSKTLASVVYEITVKIDLLLRSLALMLYNFLANIIQLLGIIPALCMFLMSSRLSNLMACCGNVSNFRACLFCFLIAGAVFAVVYYFVGVDQVADFMGYSEYGTEFDRALAEYKQQLREAKLSVTNVSLLTNTTSRELIWMDTNGYEKDTLRTQLPSTLEVLSETETESDYIDIIATQINLHEDDTTSETINESSIDGFETGAIQELQNRLEKEGFEIQDLLELFSKGDNADIDTNITNI